MTASSRPSYLSVLVIGDNGQFWLFRHFIGLPKCRNFVCIGRNTEIEGWDVSVLVFRQKNCIGGSLTNQVFLLISRIYILSWKRLFLH